MLPKKHFVLLKFYKMCPLPLGAAMCKIAHLEMHPNLLKKSINFWFAEHKMPLFMRLMRLLAELRCDLTLFVTQAQQGFVYLR